MIKVIAAARDRLQKIYEALPESRKKNVVAPQSPHLPLPIDLDTPPHEQHRRRGRRCPRHSRYLDQLATVSANIEKQRIARSYLTDSTPGKPADVRDLDSLACQGD
jgi:hypothetical protein